MAGADAVRYVITGCDLVRVSPAVALLRVELEAVDGPPRTRSQPVIT